MRQGNADIGFTYLPTTSEFTAWELLRDRYVLLLPPHSDYLNGPNTWERLVSLPLILAPADDGCRDIIDRHFAQTHLTVKPVYEVREDSTILSMVQKGLGATIMAQLAASCRRPWCA